MAKQTGPVKITGTIGNICFYEMDGKYYARMKSSLTGKRVKKDPRFRRTMEYASYLTIASKIASEIYSTLPKQRGLYRKIVGMAMQLLKLGVEREEAMLQLQEILTAAVQKEDPPQLVETVLRPKPCCRKNFFTRPLFSCITYQHRHEYRRRKKSNARIRGDTF